MTDIIERECCAKAALYDEMAAEIERQSALVSEGANINTFQAMEIERLQELLRGVGANRYWEGRWRDADAENERLRDEVERLQAETERRQSEVERRQAGAEMLLLKKNIELRQQSECDQREIERLHTIEVQFLALKEERVRWHADNTMLTQDNDRLRAAIRWTREVHPGKNPESGGAIVNMTWEEFHAMRALADDGIVAGG